MDEYKDLSDLLESDKHAMAFYNSLSMSLRRKVHKGGVNSFMSLYQSTEKSPMFGAVPRYSGMNTVSSNEATGAVPSGGDLSLNRWESARGLMPNE